MLKIFKHTLLVTFLTAITCLMLFAGSCFASDAVGSPQTRFIDHGNGTVTDTHYRLMWTKDANLFGRLNWNDAYNRCSSYTFAGYNDWRLPGKDELVSLYDGIEKGNHPFTNLQSAYYWTSSSRLPGTRFAWRLSMDYGRILSVNKSFPYYVWPVRSTGGQ